MVLVALWNKNGIDRSILQSLLQRHAHIHDEIEAFRNDVKKLEEQSQLMNETKKENVQVKEVVCFLRKLAYLMQYM